MNDFATTVRQNIKSHGFHATYVVCEDSPPYCYSTGIYETHGIPEIVISSLPPNLSYELIALYIMRFAENAPVTNSRVRKRDERFDYYLIPVDLNRVREYVLATFKYYESDVFEYLQLIYPDAAGLFPHEDGYDYDQEILGDYSMIEKA